MPRWCWPTPASGTCPRYDQSFFETLYPGVVVHAVLGTVLAFGAMLAVYAARIIRVTPRFTKVVIGMGGALVLLMLVNLVSHFFLPNGIGIRADSTLGKCSAW
ncbi:MAG: hypothetical protein GEV03_08875 [Streptosporangiales bacterium]|nr:hypothetical protein [Streptosporangiales bacterium]